MAEEKKVKLPEVTEYENHIKDLFNKRYQALIERLKTESNIILRYELKLSIESILETYKFIFPEG